MTIDDRVSRYDFCEGRVAVERTKKADADGPELWAVLHEGDCLTRSWRWEYNRLPSNRTAAFLKRCRFDREDALARAAEIERLWGYGLPLPVLRERVIAALLKAGFALLGENDTRQRYDRDDAVVIVYATDMRDSRRGYDDTMGQVRALGLHVNLKAAP